MSVVGPSSAPLPMPDAAPVSGASAPAAHAAASSDISLTEVADGSVDPSTIELSEAESDVQLAEPELDWRRDHPEYVHQMTDDDKRLGSMGLLTKLLNEHGHVDIERASRGHISARNIRYETTVKKFKVDPNTHRLIATVERSITLRVFENGRFGNKTIKVTEEVDSGVRVPEPCDDAAIELAKSKAYLHIRLLSGAITRGITDLRVREMAKRGIVPVEYTTTDSTRSYYTPEFWLLRKPKRGMPSTTQITSARLSSSEMSITDILFRGRSLHELEVHLGPGEIEELKKIPIEGNDKAEKIKEFEKEFAKIMKRLPPDAIAQTRDLRELVAKMTQAGISTDELTTVIARNAHGDQEALNTALATLRGPLTGIESTLGINITGGFRLSAAASAAIERHQEAIEGFNNAESSLSSAESSLNTAQSKLVDAKRALRAAQTSTPPTPPAQIQVLTKNVDDATNAVTTARDTVTQARNSVTQARSDVTRSIQSLKGMRVPGEAGMLSRQESLDNRIAILEFFQRNPDLRDMTARTTDIQESIATLKRASANITADFKKFTALFDAHLRETVGPIEARRVLETTSPQFLLHGKDHHVQRNPESSNSALHSFSDALSRIPGAESGLTPEQLRKRAAQYCREHRTTDDSLATRITLDMSRTSIAELIDNEIKARKESASGGASETVLEEVEDPNESPADKERRVANKERRVANERMNVYIDLMERGDIQSPKPLLHALSKLFNVNVVVTGENNREWNEDHTSLDPSQGWVIPPPSLTPKGTIYLERTPYPKKTDGVERTAEHFDPILPTATPPAARTFAINGMDYSIQRQVGTDTSCITSSIIAGLKHIKDISPPPNAAQLRAITAKFLKANFTISSDLRAQLRTELRKPATTALINAEIRRRNAAIDRETQELLDLTDPTGHAAINQNAILRKDANESEETRMNILISLIGEGRVEAPKLMMLAASEHYQVSVVVSHEEDRRLDARGALEPSAAWRGFPPISRPRGTIYLEAVGDGTHFDAIVPPDRAIPGHICHRTAEDGNCFYSAILEGLKTTPLTPPITSVRALRQKAQELCRQYLAIDPVSGHFMDPVQGPIIREHILESISEYNASLEERYKQDLASKQAMLADPSIPAQQKQDIQRDLNALRQTYERERIDLPFDATVRTEAQEKKAIEKYLSLITTDRFWGSPAELYVLSLGLHFSCVVVNAAEHTLEPYGAWRDIPPQLASPPPPIGTIYLDHEKGNHFNVMLPKPAAAGAAATGPAAARPAPPRPAPPRPAPARPAPARPAPARPAPASPPPGLASASLAAAAAPAPPPPPPSPLTPPAPSNSASADS